MFFSCNVAFSSVPVFLPTIIQESVPPPPPKPLQKQDQKKKLTREHRMGYTSLRSQALSAPPYVFPSPPKNSSKKKKN